jgi:hypothetical protein
VLEREGQVTLFVFVNSNPNPNSKSKTSMATLFCDKSGLHLNLNELGQAWIADVQDAKSKALVIAELKVWQNENQRQNVKLQYGPFVVVAADDPLLLPLLKELQQNGVDFQRVFFCLLPFSAQSDLAVVSGWDEMGRYLKPTCENTVTELLRALPSAFTKSLPFWTVEATCAVLPSTIDIFRRMELCP